MVSLQSLCNLTSDLYIERIVSKNVSNITKEGNWQTPENDRFDAFLAKYFPDKKRAYFHIRNRFTPIWQNYHITSEESDNPIDLTNYYLMYNLSLIDDLPDNVLIEYAFMEIDININDNFTSIQTLNMIEHKIDMELLTPDLLDKICAIKVPSKFISCDNHNICSQEYNLIVLDNNPLHEDILHKAVEYK